METKEFVLTYANHSGKWMEMWDNKPTTDEYGNLEGYAASCKAGKFYDLIEEANLDQHVLNHGILGLTVSFEFVSPNWKITAIRKDKLVNRNEELIKKLSYDPIVNITALHIDKDIIKMNDILDAADTVKNTSITAYNALIDYHNLIIEGKIKRD